MAPTAAEAQGEEGKTAIGGVVEEMRDRSWAKPRVHSRRSAGSCETRS